MPIKRNNGQGYFKKHYIIDSKLLRPKLEYQTNSYFINNSNVSCKAYKEIRKLL